MELEYGVERCTQKLCALDGILMWWGGVVVAAQTLIGCTWLRARPYRDLGMRLQLQSTGLQGCATLM